MANEIEIMFNELFYGAGGWIGFLLIATIMLLVTWKIKWGGIIFIPASIMIGIMLMNNLAVDDNLMWAMMMYFMMPFFLFIEMATRNRS